MDLRTFFGAPIRQLPPVVITLTMALGVAAFSIAQSLLYNVVYPVINALTGLNLRTIRIDLDGGEREFLFDKSIILGPTLASVLAASILTVVVLKTLEAAQRWARMAQVECPCCLSWVPDEATKCSYCGSDLFEAAEAAPDPSA